MCGIVGKLNFESKQEQDVGMVMSHRTSKQHPIDIGIQASSITHQHLLASVATEMRGRSAFNVVDAGCGGGALIKYLRVGLPAIFPGVGIEVDGFDVSDFAPQGNSNLASETKTVRSGDPWPYADHSVDVIISNQVLEHLFEPALFFREVARCLKLDGISVHLGPFKNVIWEDHVGVPLAHRITKPAYIRAMAKILPTQGVLKRRALALPGGEEREFGECAADYIKKYTRYMTHREAMRLTADAGLRASFEYTPRFYVSKVRSMGKRPPVYFYSKMPTFDNLSYWLARYISSITLVLRHQPIGS
jgi:SAM-dependent methyltransferase